MTDREGNPDCRTANVECLLDNGAPAPLHGQPRNAHEQIPRGGFVFWTLILLGLSTFAPCVLLPEWRDYQAARMAEQREQHRLDQLHRTKERESRQVEAMQNDPEVVARIAQRDFGFRRLDAMTVAVAVPPIAVSNEEAVFIPQPVAPPGWLAQAAGYLPDVDYDAIFCDEQTRPIVMVMSVGLIVTAIALFSGKSPARAS